MTAVNISLIGRLEKSVRGTKIQLLARQKSARFGSGRVVVEAYDT